MITKNHLYGREFAQLDNSWPASYAWAVEHMSCPAYCCSPEGAVVHCNAAAERIWGEMNQASETTRWDGFVELRDVGGQLIDKDSSPAAQAAAGICPRPTELLALCQDGQLRRVVIHAKSVLDVDGSVIGVLCSLTDISEKRILQERAQDIAGSRENFLNMLAHELRNPLAPIMNIAALLQRPSMDPDVAKMAIVLQRQTKQLARFIADLLDTSRINRLCELQIVPRVCTENEILALTLDLVEPKVRSHNQRLVVEATNRNATLCCDPGRVAQALSNVLSNASAFSPDGEKICLHVFVEGEVFRVEVVDYGAGIAAEDLPHVFEPFGRRAVAPGRAPVGAGLGLTIAKGVCDAHGGSIVIRSAGQGFGTTVSITLPVAIQSI